MTRPVDWAEELQFAARFSGYGAGPDVSAMSLVQAWGLLMFLRRLAGDVDA